MWWGIVFDMDFQFKVQCGGFGGVQQVQIIFELCYWWYEDVQLFVVWFDCQCGVYEVVDFGVGVLIVLGLLWCGGGEVGYGL